MMGAPKCEGNQLAQILCVFSSAPQIIARTDHSYSSINLNNNVGMRNQVLISKMKLGPKAQPKPSVPGQQSRKDEFSQSRRLAPLIREAIERWRRQGT